MNTTPRKIVLASSSPRRKELFESLNIPFTVDSSSVDEKINTKVNPKTFAKKLALAKVRDVAKRHKNAILIGADTIVAIGHLILGKPKDKDDAKKMLRLLNGRKHLVITGLAIIDQLSKKTISKSIVSKVWFKKLTDEQIDEYIETGEPLDKAGGYGIQGRGDAFIVKIEGEWANIVGLPLTLLTKELKKFGVY